MKNLPNHLILFDAECPLCDTYTKAFVKTGMLDAGGRASYQQLEAGSCPMVDRQRAVNEIALVNLQTGEVTYGIHSLFKILGATLPVFKGLFTFAPFVWLMTKVYRFFSYNRRVVIPVDVENKNLQPTFRLGYRVGYLVFAWLLVSYILTKYAALLEGMVPVGNAWREYLICGGQVLFQGLVVTLVAPQKRWDYLGNMMTISLAGALLLLPIVLLSSVIEAQPLFYTLYFMAVAGLMFLEHIRRSKLLHIGWVLTISWAVYRVIVLFIILFN